MPTIAQLEKLLATDPRDPFLLYGLAQEHAKAGNIDRSVELYDECLSVDPLYCYAYFHKARVLQDAGRSDAAIDAARKGIAAAKQANDSQALSELSGLLDELT